MANNYGPWTIISPQCGPYRVVGQDKKAVGTWKIFRARFAATARFDRFWRLKNGLHGLQVYNMTDQVVQNQAELARALNVSRMAVSKWIRHPTWPFGQHGPWDVGKVREWRVSFLNAVIDKPLPSNQPPAMTPELDSKLASAMQVERVKLAQVRRKKAELELSILNGEHVPLEIVKTQWGQIAEELKAALLALPKSVAPVLVGKPSEQIQTLLEEQFNRLLTDLASKPRYERS